MKKHVTFVLLSAIFLSGCALPPFNRDTQPEIIPLKYEIDLTDRSDDLFEVTLHVDDLTADNAIYQFAATAPGTYQVMDIGRFVQEFTAYDSSGNKLPVQRISTNQWQLSAPQHVTEIQYTVAETWDTPVDSNRIYPMAGTSIEADHVQINGQCVFGYPTGMQSRPLQIKLEYPEDWLIGTALKRNKHGYFTADNYDHVVDSPFLLGDVTHAELKVKGSEVAIYTYSKTGKVTSEQILNSVKDILLASAEFMEGLPVERYAFLFHFEDATYGAWEHSYSSLYSYNEADFDVLIRQNIPDVVAHEFYHIVTPLNIHSEIIEQFNFVEPVPSEHLWLYEGVTEWAAHMLQLRGGLIDLERYLQVMQAKMNTSEAFRDDYSLRDLALNSFTRAGQQQYPNIYMRGAVVAGLLDILILDLSAGKRGLREVINELSEDYGPEQAFSEEGFYDEFAKRTYPEVEHFFDSYVKNAEPLPLAEYYGKLGISYREKVATGEMEPTAGFNIFLSEGKLALTNVEEEAKGFGLQDGDHLLGYNGIEVTLKNARQQFEAFKQLEADVPYKLTIERGGEVTTFTCHKFLEEKIEHHVFAVDSSATQAQLKLRQAWMKNL